MDKKNAQKKTGVSSRKNLGEMLKFIQKSEGNSIISVSLPSDSFKKMKMLELLNDDEMVEAIRTAVMKVIDDRFIRQYEGLNSIVNAMNLMNTDK